MIDTLEAAFLRLRHAADADEYVPTEQVIDTVLARLTRAEKENRWEAYAAFGSNYKDVTAEVIALREERDEVRLLATRVEAKRLDEAHEEIARLREACTLALGVMEQKNRVTVLPTAKFVDVKFAPEDIAVLRAALEEKAMTCRGCGPGPDPEQDREHNDWCPDNPRRTHGGKGDAAELRVENERLRSALADIARGDYSDPLCMRTPEQRAREALAPKKEKP